MTERPPFDGSDVFGVAGVALAYREFARCGYVDRRSLLEEFRVAAEAAAAPTGPLKAVRASILGLWLLGEFKPIDFAVVEWVIYLDALEDEMEWDEQVREQSLAFGCLVEPFLHALRDDPRDAVSDLPVAAGALARWSLVEAAMHVFEELGGTQPLSESWFTPRQWSEVKVLQERVAAIAGELYVD